MNRLPLLLALLPCTAFSAGTTPPGNMDAMPDMSAHVMADAASLQWGPVPPMLPAGAQLAVLSGDPGKAGHYTIRLKAPAGYAIAAHWHPADERVTVLEGGVTLSMGDGAAAHSHAFGPEDYVVMPAKMHHAASMTADTIVQIDGEGPFEITYLDPKDDPRTAMPAQDDDGDSDDQG